MIEHPCCAGVFTLQLADRFLDIIDQGIVTLLAGDFQACLKIWRQCVQVITGAVVGCRQLPDLITQLIDQLMQGLFGHKVLKMAFWDERRDIILSPSIVTTTQIRRYQ